MKPRVAVTRDEPSAGELSTALRAAGLEPLHCPLIQRRVVADIRPHLQALGPNDWLVLTSPFAIEAVHGPVPCRVAVVGPASASAARARGMRVERTSPDNTGEGLFRSLREDPAGAAVICYPRSSLTPHPHPIPGVRIDSPVLYETAPRPFDARILQSAAVVSFASPSAVLAAPPGVSKPAALGPTTAAALRRRGIEPWLECKAGTFTDFAQAIARHLMP